MSTVGSPSTVLRVTANCVTLANDDSFFFQKPAPPKVTPITPITTITTITSEKKKKSAPAGAPQKALSEHDYCAPPLYSYHLTSDVLQPISDQVNEFHFLMVDPRSNRPIPLPPVRARFEVRKNGGGGGGDDEEEVVCHCSECAENEPDNEPDSLLNEEAVITVEQVQQQKRKQQKQRKKQQQPKEQPKRPSSKSKAPKGALVAKKSPAQKKKKGLPLLSGGSNFISPVASTSTAFALRQILPKPSPSSATLPSLSTSSSSSPSSMIIFADGIQTTSAPLAIHPSLSSLSRNNNNSKNNISNKSNSNTKKSSIGGGKSIISNINTKKSSSGGGKSISNIGIPTAAKTAASKKARKKVNKFEAGGGVGALLKVKEEKEEPLSLPPPVSISAEKSNSLPPKKKKKERPGPPPADLLCAHCLKTFASRTNLRKHLFRVQGIFPFSCGLCGTGVLYKRLLKEHRCGQQQEPKTTSGDAHLQQQPVSTSTWSSSMEEVVVKKEEEPENEAVKLLYIQPEPDQPHPQPEPDSTVTTTFSELLSAFD